jgi:hypothetical protein
MEFSMWHSDSVERCHPASMTPTQDPEEDDIGIEVEEFRETDKDRHQTMMTSMDSSEANELRTGTLSDFWGDFILPKCPTRGGYDTGDDNTTGDQASPRGISQRAASTSTSTCTTPAPVRTGRDPESFSSRSRPGSPAKEEMWRGEHGSLGHTVAKALNTIDSTVSNSKPNLNVDDVTEIRVYQEISKWPCLVCTL